MLYMKRNNKLATFYRKEMVPPENTKNFSLSPQKPKKLMEFLDKHGLSDMLDIKDEFPPFPRCAFYLAHEQEYVNDFFEGRDRSNGLEPSLEFSESVKYTNASLYYAMREAWLRPNTVSLAPVSGMHHASPNRGAGFCSMSGQVIAAVLLYIQYGISGGMIDLDGHFGNSIEDSRFFDPIVTKAIPEYANLNPQFHGENYIDDFVEQLEVVRQGIERGEIDYLVFCHGADSHIYDDLGGQVDTEQWLRCSQIFYEFVRDQCPPNFPLTLSLFGGYRKDNYNSVLALHSADLNMCLTTLSEYPNNVDILAKEVIEPKWMQQMENFEKDMVLTEAPTTGYPLLDQKIRMQFKKPDES